MNSTYQRGLSAGAITIPEHPVLSRIRDANTGFKFVRMGEPRFYQRGVMKVGANTPGAPGGLIDGLVGLILDLAHVLLIIGGMYLLWTAIRG